MNAQASALARLRGDFFGGLTAGIVALPLALAFGVASGAGAAAGLYGAIVLGFVAALLGGTRMQISGPTGPMTVVFASALAVVGGDAALAMAAVLVGGLVQIGLGVLRTGGLVRFIPYPVVSGFMSGIGVIIVLLQSAPLLGVAPAPSPLAAVLAFPGLLAKVNAEALLLGGLTLLIVFRTPMTVSRIVPAPLVALVTMSALSAAADLQVPVIGDIPAGLPVPALPSFTLETWTTVLLLGITLGVLGSIDSLLTSLVADSITRTRHHSNRELVGQGIGNLLCAFVGGLPGAGATMRTVINIKSGGRGRASGVVHSLFLLALLLGLGPLAERIPLAVLAGILIKVGVDILDYRMLRLVRTAPRADVAVMAAVFALTVLVDLIVAVGAGVILSMALIIHRLARQSSLRVRPLPHAEEGGQTPAGDELPGLDSGVRVIEIEGAFFFGSASQLLDRVDQVIGTRVVVFDCSRVPFMDLSAQFALEEMIEGLQAQSIAARVVVPPEIHAQLLRLGAPQLPAAILHDELDAALAAARRLAAARPQPG
ncbi:SulP family inorganic anion transporter [Thauera aminoaromatica]|uniref:SulP family inorganic anion transporter n=1 Tax=Thauera aminoaromatica TaxID=164330 RepID=A0A5C7T856_THASP|nr:SulP family inorganic anion transporter [Thauera aminoaromatica]TXH91476.1 MAG: SulP family inorganic anion transporter [Thauera aminoaromatica]